MFAINRLSNLFGVDSDDGLSLQSGRDEVQVASTEGDIPHKTEGEVKSEVTKAGEPDDDSTAEISESSSFGSPAKSDSFFPPTDDESRESGVQEAGAGNSSLVLSDIDEDDKVSVVAIEDTIAHTTPETEGTEEIDKGNNEVQGKDLCSFPVQENETCVKATLEVVNEKVCRELNQEEVQVNYHNGDGKTKEKEKKTDVVSANEFKLNAQNKDTEDDEVSVASIIDPSDRSSTFGFDVETAQDSSMKSKKDCDQAASTPTNKSGENDYPSKEKNELKVESKNDEEKQDVVKEGIVILKVGDKANASETKSDKTEQVEVQTESGLVFKKQTVMVVATVTRKAVTTEISVDDTRRSTDAILVGLHKVESENINSSEENNTLPMPKGETSSLTLAQRMKEVFDSSSPDQASNAFGKRKIRSSVTIASRKEGVHTDSAKTVSLAKEMKAMLDSSPNLPSNVLGKCSTILPSLSLSKVKEDISNAPMRSFSSAKDIKEMFDPPSPNQPSKAFGRSKESVETQPPKPVSLARDMKAIFDSPSPDKSSKAFCAGKKDEVAMKPASLAKDMKAIFDSPSPDTPSRAFGADQKPSSLARNMKIRFDSLSQDRSSRAFGVDKGIIRDLKGPETAFAKSQRDVNTAGTEESNEKAKSKSTKLDSHVSAADQMVTLFWASKKPIKQSPLTPIHPKLHASTEQVVDEKVLNEIDDVVTRDTIIDDDTEEITVDDEDGYDNYGIASNCDDDSFDEIIEEVSIDDDHSKDDLCVTTEDEPVEGTTRIQLALDLVDIGEKEGVDEHSYDEITADDLEYDEKTVDDDDDDEDDDDDDDDIVSLRDQIEHIEPGIRLEEKSENIIEEHTNNAQNIDQTGLDSSGNELTEIVQQRGDVTNQKAVVKKDDGAKIKRGDKKRHPTTPAIDLSAPAKHIETTLSPTSESLKALMLNPRILGNRSATGTLAEKLKMFDSPKASSHQPDANIFNQSWLKSKPKPKPLIKSPSMAASEGSTVSNGYFEKTHVILPVVEPRETTTDRLNPNPSNKPGYNERDKALVEEIVQLVKEPGIMLNKRSLAERITSLLTSNIKEKTPSPLPKMPLTKNHMKTIQHPLPTNNHVAEASMNSNRKKDSFNDSGLAQVRNDVGKKKINRADDPDTIPNRAMERMDMKEREKPIRQLFTEEQNAKSEKETPITSAFDKTQKMLSAEEIIARIWPKTPNGEDKRKPKSFSTPSRVAKSFSFERPIKSPSKLGNRLKMFQTPPSSVKPDRPRYISSIDKALAKMANDNMVAIDNEVNNMSLQISDETVSSIILFQRLWRTRRKILHSNTSTRQKKKFVFKTIPISQSATTSLHGNTINVTSRPKSIKKCDNISIPVVSNPENDPADVSLSKSGKIISTNVQSSGGSTESADFRGCYSLEDLEQGRFDPNVFDIARWEGFLTDESFHEHFGLTKENFYRQPKWKRDNQKRKVRVSF